MQRLIMRRALLLSAAVLIVTLIVGPIVLVWGGLFTARGAQFIVRHIPHRIGGVTLDIVGLTGTAAGGLHVERVEIDHELVHLKFTDISGRVALTPLLLQTIRATSARARTAEVQVKRRAHPPKPSPPSFLPRWLLISADDAHVDSATLTVYNGFRLVVTDIDGAAVMRHQSIRFFQADGVLEGAHVNAIGELRATDPLGFQLEGHLDWHPQGQPAYVADGSVRGDLNILNIVARTASPFRADINGQLRDLTSHVHFVGNALLHNFELGAWGVSGPLGSITGHLSLSGDLKAFHAAGPLNPTGLRAGEFQVQFDGGFAEHVLTARRMEARHVASGARASGAGTIAVVEHGPRLDLKGSWNDFRWPLAGREPALRSASGSYSLQGVMPYRVHITGDFRAADLPVMPADIVGTLDKGSFAFEHAEVDLYGGHTSTSGRVSWAPQETWDISGHASNINPGTLRADLPGSLTFDFTTQGRGFDTKANLSASFSNLGGKLRGASAGGGGTITHAGKTWGFDALKVTLGSANLALDGTIDDRMSAALRAHDPGPQPALGRQPRAAARVRHPRRHVQRSLLHRQRARRRHRLRGRQGQGDRCRHQLRPRRPRQGVQDRCAAARAQLPDAHPGCGNAPRSPGRRAPTSCTSPPRAPGIGAQLQANGAYAPRHLRGPAHLPRPERQRRPATHARSPRRGAGLARPRAPRVAVPRRDPGQHVRGRRTGRARPGRPRS